MNIILGTGSKLRQRAMERLGLPFTIALSNFDEESIVLDDIDQTIMAIAKGKAALLAKAYPDAIIVTADSNNLFEGKSYGKPKSLKQAREWLQLMRGKTQEFHTALVVTLSSQMKRSTDVNISYITFNNFSDEEINHYFSQVNPLTMAIGWSADGPGKKLLAKFKGEPGSEFALPLDTLKKRLREFGVKI
ncbi:MAG: hypothetical protein A3B31_00285 [Candidatus Komeilibacteria bacterium RIFCSPLOWO2_01_FULL_53_11]|uniref:Nucleoside triphosphate pyrophosphatase n=1 Tax=Candidatus Komeilibacteria bacterium RIFCSPLOWO2_01_FULL_53_11 TaxID=1798552 RepID=A0A1G2BR52_9BACT|nr:MAG: hypothetical protein A3B31_00285 [Candidatus Komeilibacteria bacterium RIFCSPLOWO2_01_FULL_53_11]